MTTVTLNPTYEGRMRGLWLKLMDMRKRHAIYKATLNELQRLSDRELRDIGIHRSQIRHIAESAYHLSAD